MDHSIMKLLLQRHMSIDVESISYQYNSITQTSFPPTPHTTFPPTLHTTSPAPLTPHSHGPVVGTGPSLALVDMEATVVLGETTEVDVLGTTIDNA